MLYPDKGLEVRFFTDCWETAVALGNCPIKVEKESQEPVVHSTGMATTLPRSTPPLEFLGFLHVHTHAHVQSRTHLRALHQIPSRAMLCPLISHLEL